MTKRVLTILFAASLALGAAACSKSIDKEGTIDDLVESGLMTQAQAECTVDRVDSEFGDDDDVIEELTKSDPDLAPEDEQKLTEIIGACMTGGGTTETTAGG